MADIGQRVILLFYIKSGSGIPVATTYLDNFCTDAPDRDADIPSRFRDGSFATVTSELQERGCAKDSAGSGGEGGIRTLGPPQRGQRFSRPPRSTAPAPLHPNGGDGLAQAGREQQGNNHAVHTPFGTPPGPSPVFMVFRPSVLVRRAAGCRRRSRPAAKTERVHRAPSIATQRIRWLRRGGMAGRRVRPHGEAAACGRL